MERDRKVIASYGPAMNREQAAERNHGTRFNADTELATVRNVLHYHRLFDWTDGLMCVVGVCFSIFMGAIWHVYYSKLSGAVAQLSEVDVPIPGKAQSEGNGKPRQILTVSNLPLRT